MPKRIEFEGEIYVYNEDRKDYINEINDFHSETILFRVMSYHLIKEILSCKVEIIEEQEDIDIQAIGEINIRPYRGFVDICNYIEEKGNELIKSVKQLDKKINKE